MSPSRGQYYCTDVIFLCLCLGRRKVGPAVLSVLPVVCAGGVLRVLSRPGQPVTLPCPYRYEDGSQLSELSVQWRSPDNELLCHFIKHKAFQRCSAGYAIAYSPGNITLTIRRARPRDLGAHVCSVSKRDEFSDCSVELATMSGECGRRGGGASAGIMGGDRKYLSLQIRSLQHQTEDGGSRGRLQVQSSYAGY